jgi:3-dehydroquinate dehydratase-2
MAEGRTIFVLNGPNLNLLGTREPEIYGYDTLDDIADRMSDVAERAGVSIEFRQSNHEGVLVDWLHEARTAGAMAVIINPGALTHTSIALLDAIKAIQLPVIEVHLSNPHAREAFRHKSYVGMAAKGTVAGFGPLSYMLALEAALEMEA